MSNAPDYDAGLLNDFGAGNVDWWQDYLRAEIGRANDHWRDLYAAALARAEEAERQRDEWRSDFRALENVLVGDTGLSAMTVAVQARLFKPRAEAAAAEATVLRARLGDQRMCVACGAVRDAALGRDDPGDCGAPDACTWDMTPEEAANHWRQVAHDRAAILATGGKP